MASLKMANWRRWRGRGKAIVGQMSASEHVCVCVCGHREPRETCWKTAEEELRPVSLNITPRHDQLVFGQIASESVSAITGCIILDEQLAKHARCVTQESCVLSLWFVRAHDLGKFFCDNHWKLCSTTNAIVPGQRCNTMLLFLVSSHPAPIERETSFSISMLSSFYFVRLVFMFRSTRSEYSPTQILSFSLVSTAMWRKQDRKDFTKSCSR